MREKEEKMMRRTDKWGATPWKIRFRAKKRLLPRHVDFAIVGGGFAGLSAAAWLARLASGKSVLLLEAEQVGNGASGRTGGMALSQTAAGDLPGLGDVLGGYRKIIRDLRIQAELDLPGVWEIARHKQSMEGEEIHPMDDSPIQWEDSGRVQAVSKVRGGTINPGKVISGLAHAAEKAGAQIMEFARVVQIEFSNPPKLHVQLETNYGVEIKVLTAKQVLLTTNAGSRELAGQIYEKKDSAEPRLTFAIAIAPLTKKQISYLGMESGSPFYTVDLPYLWGRMMRNGGMIFGSGLVPAFGKYLQSDSERRKSQPTVEKIWSGLERFDVQRGEPAVLLRALGKRVRALHPALKNMRVTHRWCGPIMITKEFMPVFQLHPASKNVVVLGGFSGHGVALSVYLGHRAAQYFAGKSKLPRWKKT
jgi:gamma-glutamylputrescine oxidase